MCNPKHPEVLAAGEAATVTLPYALGHAKQKASYQTQIQRRTVSYKPRVGLAEFQLLG